jgi:hypothetical protein
MPNDAKFGLLVGVTMVIAMAVVFFRNDPAGTPAANPSTHFAKSLTLPAGPASADPTPEQTVSDDSAGTQPE